MAEDAAQPRFLILKRAVILLAALIGGSLLGYGITVAIVGFLHVTGS